MAYLVIMLSCIAVFYRTLKYDIVVDDDYFRHNGKAIKPKHFFDAIQKCLVGLKPVNNKVLDHAITLTIHTVVCMLIYKAFGSIAVSLLFAFNLSNNQVSIWMNGKRSCASTRPMISSTKNWTNCWKNLKKTRLQKKNKNRLYFKIETWPYIL